MKRLTLFSFGYDGWGNATDQLVEAIDAVELARGFDPPIFIDIRIQRSVRAVGFRDHAFEDLLGAGRHWWMKSLGNLRIQSRQGPAIQIADPLAAGSLIDIALEAARHNRRLVFFCGCKWPRECHRAKVASLVLQQARRRSIPVEVVEWPGTPAQHIELPVKPDVFGKVVRGGASIPLPGRVDLAELAGLPWGSIASLHSNDEVVHRLVGPVRWTKGQWVLPILGQLGPDENLSAYRGFSEVERRKHGLEPRAV